MSERLRVLFIARWYPVRMDSMLGLFVVRHALAVKNYAHVNVINAAADINLNNSTYETEVNTIEGIESIIVYFKKSNYSFINFYRNVNSYFKAYNHYKAKNGQPHICHVHVLSRTAVLALYLKLIYHIPYLITEHWSRYLPRNVKKGSYKGFFRKLFTKIAVSGAFGVTTVTENLKSSMQVLGLKNKYFVVPNAVDTDKFALTEKINQDEKIILHVSCFEEVSKNIKGLINSTEQLLKQRSDFELWLVGDGIDKKMIENYVASKNISQGKIKFKGLLEGAELAKVMRNATFQVLFSNYESQPSVIIESFASGVPFVATAVGGIPEIIDERRGILVEPGNESQLTEAMNTMLDNYSKFDTNELQNYVGNKFSLKVVGKQFYDLYLKMISAR
ncbi:MAG: glycosyltransferase [Bacteroidia bacterium]